VLLEAPVVAEETVAATAEVAATLLAVFQNERETVAHQFSTPTQLVDD
jgi:hypothetical protein